MNVNADNSINNGIQTEETAAQKQQKALQVAQQFEEIFVRMMVESLRKSKIGDGGGMFGNSVGSNTYAQWFDQHMSEHLTKTTSIGIRDTLIREFRRNGELPPEKKGVNHVA